MLRPGADVQACCTEAVEEVRETCVAGGLQASDCGVVGMRISTVPRAPGSARVVSFAAVTSSESMGIGHALAAERSQAQVHSFVQRRPSEGRARCTAYGRSVVFDLKRAGAASA